MCIQLGMLITSDKSPCHRLLHIFNSYHTTSTVPRRNFIILRWNIGSIPIIYFTIVIQVEVVFGVVIPIFEIMPLAVTISIVLTLVSLTLAPNLLIGAFGIRSKTPRFIIHYIGVLLILIFLIWRWWFR